MKVIELIELLQKEDPKMEVLTSDLDEWYYNISNRLLILPITKGRKDEVDGEECVIIDALW